MGRLPRAGRRALAPLALSATTLVVALLSQVVAPSAGAAQRPAGAPTDPGTSGPYATTTRLYDIGGQVGFTVPRDATNDFTSGVEVEGEIDYPTDISSLGSLPVVLIMSGADPTCHDPSTGATATEWPCRSPFSSIPNYRGFDYLARGLASEGIVAVSISTNGIEAQDAAPHGNPAQAPYSTDAGLLARAELAEHHLRLLARWNTSTSGPFGSTFVGHLDLADVGLIGQGRGGGGVARLVAYNTSLGSPFTVAAVEGLSPYWDPGLNPDLGADITGVPDLTFEAYCDNTTPDDGGVAYVDLDRYPGDSAPRTLVVAISANDTYWSTSRAIDPAGTPSPVAGSGGSDVTDKGPVAPYCGASPARRTPHGQQDVALAYSRAFMALHLLGAAGEAPYFEATVAPPAHLGRDEVRVAYIPPVSDRLVVDSFSSSSSLTKDDLGQPVTVSAGGGTVRMCGPVPSSCVTGDGAPRTSGEEPETSDGLVEQAHVTWSGTGTSVSSALDGPTDLSGATVLVRVGVDFGVAQPTPDLSIELTDASGHRAAVAASASTQPLFKPPVGLPPYGGREFLQTISVPVSAFEGIDAAEVTSIGLDFDRTPRGALDVADLMVTNVPGSVTPALAESPSAGLLGLAGIVILGGVVAAGGLRRRLRSRGAATPR